MLGGDNRSASQILDERDALFSREGNEFRRKRGFHKTAHEEIAAMNFENESCVGPNCFRVIVERGLICRADLAQSRPGRLDNFADAKAAADLDQFAARDYNFRFVPGKMPNNQHQRRRAIIDNSGRFCSAQQCERLLDVIAPPTALAGSEIIFEIRIRRTDLAERTNRFGSEWRPPKVRVNDNSSPVNDRL